MSIDSNPSNTQDPTTNPWIMRLQSDDDSVRDRALEELREILVRGLSKPMGRRYAGGLQADDVVQEAMIKILDSLDQFQGRSRFTTWAMTIATRIGISEMRRKHYRDVSIESFESDDAMRIEIAVDDAVPSDQRLDQQSIIAKLQKVIDSELTEKQRFAIRAALDGLPVEVIAEKYGSNRNSVYKLVHDARQKLRRALENAGIAADDIATTFA